MFTSRNPWVLRDPLGKHCTKGCKWSRNIEKFSSLDRICIPLTVWWTIQHTKQRHLQCYKTNSQGDFGSSEIYFVAPAEVICLRFGYSWTLVEYSFIKMFCLWFFFVVSVKRSWHFWSYQEIFLFQNRASWETVSHVKLLTSFSALSLTGLTHCCLWNYKFNNSSVTVTFLFCYSILAV